MTFPAFLCFGCRNAGKAETKRNVRCLDRNAERIPRPPHLLEDIDLDDFDPLKLDACTGFKMLEKA